jgi:hypothetical protein
MAVHLLAYLYTGPNHGMNQPSLDSFGVHAVPWREIRKTNHQLLLVRALWARHDDLPINEELRPILRPADTVVVGLVA